MRCALHYHSRSGEGRNPERQPCVYLLVSKRNGTLYCGVTSNLAQRVWLHQSQSIEGFTKQYGVRTLVWYEAYATMESVIVREEAIKGWRRAWKIALIEKSNPRWLDLYEELGKLGSVLRRNDDCGGIAAHECVSGVASLDISPIGLEISQIQARLVKVLSPGQSQSPSGDDIALDF